jgi:glutathione S-transferase
MSSDQLKLYETNGSPNSRRVRMFLAEKGIAVSRVPVDLAAKEQFSEAYTKINPRRVVPTLVLADETAIGEVPAILRYLEEIHPNSPLLGTSPQDKALVTTWERRMELEGFAAVMETVRNAAAGLKGRAIAGAHDNEQIPALVERGRQRVNDFYADLEARLARRALCRRQPVQRGRHHRDRDRRFRHQVAEPAHTGRPCRIRALVRVGLCPPEHGRLGPARA